MITKLNIAHFCLCHYFAAIIPFGWGQEDDNYAVDEVHQQQSGIEVRDRATLKGSAAAAKALNSVSHTGGNSCHNNASGHSPPLNVDNPHEVMATEMTETGETSDLHSFW